MEYNNDILSVYLGSPWIFVWLILFAGFALGLFRFGQMSASGRAIWMIIAASLVAESAAFGLILFSLERMTAYRLLNIVHFVLYGWAYLTFVRHTSYAKWYLYTGVILAVYTLGRNILNEGFTTMPTETVVVQNVWCIVASLVVFYGMTKRPTQESLFRSSLFWFNAANLVYFSSTFFDFAMFDLFVEKFGERSQWAANLRYTMNYLLYGSYIVAIALDFGSSGSLMPRSKS